MINIKRKGLLYRLAFWGAGWEEYKIDQYNLCPFTRQAVFGLLLCVVATLSGAFVGTLLLAPPASLYVYIVTGHFSLLGTFGLFILLGLITYLVVLTSGVTIGVRALSEQGFFDRIRELFTGLPGVSKASSAAEIIGAWADAVHNKFCPRINIIEENQDERR